MWACTALAALCGVVVLVGGLTFEGDAKPASFFIECHDVNDAEMGVSRFVENIEVACGPVSAEPPTTFAVCHVPPICHGERIGSAVRFNTLLGAEQSNTAIDDIGKGEIESFGERKRHYVRSGIDVQVVCRCLTCVFDLEMDGNYFAYPKHNIRPCDISDANNNVGPQLLLGGTPGIFHLAQYDDDKKERRDSKEKREQGYRVIDSLVDQPRKAGLISMIVGILCGAIGRTFYLKRNAVVSRAGLALVCLGMLTPLFPWWLLALIWWAGQ